jgi:3-hydroxyacyl-[acyl-carrier-protein] dehydratase
MTDPIAAGLPHRPPFVFVEKIDALEPGRTARCSKFFAATEPFFRGHFPGNPLVPGVILAEGMAQTAGIAAGEPGRIFHLSAIKLMKFLKPVLPESRVVFSAEKTAAMNGMIQFRVSAAVNEETVAEGVIILAEA